MISMDSLCQTGCDRLELRTVSLFSSSCASGLGLKSADLVYFT